MRIDTLKTIANAIATGADTVAAIDAAMVGETGIHWVRDMAKLRQTAIDGLPRFSIFAKDGNGKLPFLAFSSLPGAGLCPGAGACLTFCYSFKAWRYPAAFCRMAQNAILLRSPEGRAAILSALDTFEPTSGTLDFRLYVDGDFHDVECVREWFAAIADRPWLRAYGYSKSFFEILEAAQTVEMPANYRLNLSSGHRHGVATVEAMRSLSITRGAFVAVSVGHKVSSSEHGTSAHNALLRAAHGRRAFTCPGKCGSCTPSGHACGSQRFAGIDIIIAVH